MFNFFKKLFTRPTPFSPTKLYNLSLLSNKTQVKMKDLTLIHLFLNFIPETENLRCIIEVFGEYADTVRAYIYCQSKNEDWHKQIKDILPFEDFLEFELVNEEIDEYLNLIGIDEDDFKLYKNDKESILEQTARFINEDKKDFQSSFSKKDKLFIQPYSDVNTFKIVWGTEKYLNYMEENYG